MKILKTNEDEQKVWSVVLEPNIVDLQGDVVDSKEIADAAHGYLERYFYGSQSGDPFFKVNHETNVTGQVRLLESYVAPDDLTFETGVTVSKGAWIVCLKIDDKKLWQKVKDGSLGAFSVGGTAKRTPEEE